MKRTLITTAAVLACALAVCALSLAALTHAVSEAGDLCSAAVLAVEERRVAQAKSLMVELAEYWEAHAAMLEFIVNHDALNEVAGALAEAQICLECEDRDDFLRTMSTVRAGLEHLRFDESLCWQNLY